MPASRAYVVDASVAVKLLLPEPGSDVAARLFAESDLAGGSPVAVPDIFYAECANVLWMAVRRIRMDVPTAERQFGRLLEIPVVRIPTRPIADRVLKLALEAGISAYDACYVAVARLLSRPLVTADEKLARKLKSSGIAVLSLTEFGA